MGWAFWANAVPLGALSRSLPLARRRLRRLCLVRLTLYLFFPGLARRLRGRFCVLHRSCVSAPPRGRVAGVSVGGARLAEAAYGRNYLLGGWGSRRPVGGKAERETRVSLRSTPCSCGVSLRSTPYSRCVSLRSTQDRCAGGYGWRPRDNLKSLGGGLCPHPAYGRSSPTYAQNCGGSALNMRDGLPFTV